MPRDHRTHHPRPHVHRRLAAMKPRLLDLFCGAGGASVGYARAGFDVTGVDIRPQPHYPFKFHQGDALTFPLDGFDVVTASPPCQAHTNASNRWRGQDTAADHHEDLVDVTRQRLMSSGLPWVMENVVGAPMPNRVILHGGMFGLGVARPRLFESNVLLMLSWAAPAKDTIGVYGEGPDGRRLSNQTTQRAASSLQEAQVAMGIDWMEWDEIKLAIPPAYTEFIGHQLMSHIRAVAA